MLIWRGKSKFTGESISFAVTGYNNKSKNPKTGAMLQGFLTPTKHLDFSGNDSVCGDCPLSRNGCYVNRGFSVYQVFKRWVKNKRAIVHPEVWREKLTGIGIRFGADGDPSLLPIPLIKSLIKTCKIWTGYTSQHAKGWAQPYQKYFMASVRSLAEKNEANARGWKTYRIIRKIEELDPSEIICPASEYYKKKTGKTITCLQCKLCCGTSSRTTKDIAIIMHGGKGKLGQIKKYLNIVNQV